VSDVWALFTEFDLYFSLRLLKPALFVGGWALAQLWLFWLAPLTGEFAAGLVYPLMAGEKAAAPEVTPQAVS